MLKKKDILYIVHNYNSFQKDSIEEAAKYFRNVYVLVRYKPLSRFVKKIPIKWLKKYDDSYVIDSRNLPSNVKIFKTPVWYLPFGIFYKWLGKLHYKAVETVIQKYNIKFDLVHSHFIWSSGYVGMKIKERYHVPFVVTGHGFDVYSLPFKDKQWMRICREILSKADKIITVSSFNKGYILKLVEDKSKISVIYNGFSPEIFYPIEKIEARKKLNIEKSGKICVSVGNLVKIKGYDYLIKAFSGLEKNHENVSLYIVGSGSCHSKLSKIIQNLNLVGKVHLVGAKPHNEIVNWINSADILVISSLREGAPVVLLESLSCGVPVVGTDVGIVSDVLTSTSYGYICKTKDVNDLKEKIQMGLSKEWNKKKIAKYGSQFTWSDSIKNLVKVYSNLLETTFK